MRERLPAPGHGGRFGWRSPLRGPWLTSMFASVLLIGLPIVTITGLLSYVAYGPDLGQAMPGRVGALQLPTFEWPTSPSWLYRLTQGLHVDLGMVLIPFVLAKLWSVMPKLFAWPPVRSPAELLERASLLLLVGGIWFEIVTGVLNIQYDYVFGFSFYTAHYFGAWVFIGAFLAHVALKLRVLVPSLRSRSLRRELRTGLAGTEPEPPDEHGLVAARPTAPTVSRRGAIGLVSGSAGLVAVLTAGQSIGGPARSAALLLPRGRSPGHGPGGFQINRTAAAAGVRHADVGTGWRLALHGHGRVRTFSRADLLAMSQRSATLPIACVEGWSTTQRWRGVPLRELAALAGVPHPSYAVVHSLERSGAFATGKLHRNQVLAADALLALSVNGVELPLDHGYPARVIVPALPGVHNTKWVASIEFHREPP